LHGARFNRASASEKRSNKLSAALPAMYSAKGSTLSSAAIAAAKGRQATTWMKRSKNGISDENSDRNHRGRRVPELKEMSPWGFYDLKGKVATDMCDRASR